MSDLPIWIISFLSIAAVIIRPFKLPEAVWAVIGAGLLVLTGFIEPSNALAGMAKGLDVYLFLTGMMLLAETAREERLFNWLAAHAARLAHGSSQLLFLYVYVVGAAVTVFLSNDATAVVLTPAVAAAVKTAKVEKPLPYLLICAFIANAASFVLPISNPANLVIYGSNMLSLLQWLPLYILPSVFAVAVTYWMLLFTQRKVIEQKIELEVPTPVLAQGGKMALWGIGITAIVLLVCSIIDIQLGLPTAITGLLTTLIVILRTRKNPRTVIKGVSWSVLLLVAGLFVIVEALKKTGAADAIAGILHQEAQRSLTKTVWESGFVTAFASNIINNLPAGLLAGNAVGGGHIPEIIKSSILIGVDLGPNLSVTGSLATILWLVALRREGYNISAWHFLKLGFLIMVPALIFAIAALWI